MTIFCLGALLAGLVAASLIPFLPFACAVAVAIAIGSATVVVEGATLGRTLLSAAVVLVVSQVGYGLGLLLAAAVTGRAAAARRAGKAEQTPPAPGPLRTGDGPR